MSTWISKTATRAGLLACLTAVSGCLPGTGQTPVTVPGDAIIGLDAGRAPVGAKPDPNGATDGATDGATNGTTKVAPAAATTPRSTRTFDGPPPTRMALAQGRVIVAGPRGFCIDRAASQERSKAPSLVVLASCSALGAGLFAPRPAVSAILTATVSPTPGPGALDQAGPTLGAYFGSDRGRAALSRAGDPGSVQVLDSMLEDGAFVMHLRDTAPFPGGAVDPDYWRAILDTGGRMVTVSVYTAPERALSPTAGKALLRDYVTSLRQATAKGLGSGG